MSRRDGPQITDIASVLATRLPNEGTPADETAQALRSGLYYARKAGIMDLAAERLAQDAPHDPVVAQLCKDLQG